MRKKIEIIIEYKDFMLIKDDKEYFVKDKREDKVSLFPNSYNSKEEMVKEFKQIIDGCYTILIN